MSWRDDWRRMLAWFERRRLNPLVAAAHLAVVGAFIAAVTQFYVPGKGFSYLISFGGQQNETRISKVQRMTVYVDPSSPGYDAQYYVQIAMDPSLQNRELRGAIDNLAYRGRRILFPAVAWGLGFGRPSVIIEAYALLNVLSWLLLAVLLLHWFPLSGWDRFARWAGVLACFGLAASFRNALVDGPSLTLITFGLYLADQGRPGWSTATLALAGLGKETNLLGASLLLPRRPATRGDWGRALARGVLVVVPLALWLVYLALRVGPVMEAGERNFAPPFVGWYHKWSAVLPHVGGLGGMDHSPLWNFLTLVALTVQMLFLLLRPRWNEAWWRVGASFAVLMIFLGDAVWEGYPGAACRVLVPMQVAFNVLVPAGRRWTWLLLLAGNLSIFGMPTMMMPPPTNGFVYGGNPALFSNSAGRGLTFEFGPEGWYGYEGSRSYYWSWSNGRSEHIVENPHAFPVLGRLRFSLNSAGNRAVRLKINGTEIWSTRLLERQVLEVSLPDLRFPPGRSVIEWSTDQPPIVLPHETRPLAFNVQNLRFDVLRRAPDDPPLKAP